MSNNPGRPQGSLIDIHTHTFPYSDDSDLKPAELIERAKAVGLDGICITEHDWFWGEREIARLSAKHSLLVLPGVEVATEEAHLLVFGLHRYTFGMHRASFVRQQVDQAGGAIIVAHPYRRQFPPSVVPDGPDYYPTVVRACENPVFGLADALEVANGRATQQQNAFSLEVSRRLDIRGCGGSDAHKLADVGVSATWFENKVTSLDEFVAELKAGRFRPARAPAAATDSKASGHILT